MAYLPYVEPGLDIIFPLSIFIFILNITRGVLDKFLYCGLIGEIFIGILFGTPITGTSWLGVEIQETIQCLGYLGLICLVFEGGLITDLGLLRKTIWITFAAAVVGILVPMALSFSIMGMKFITVEGSGYPTALAAFSAGVSLCSTSLGSTFIILASANLQKTPTGTLIAGAAMIDDMVVLVMVKIVTALGRGQSNPWKIARPAVSSLCLIIGTFLLTQILIQPMDKAFRAIFASQKVDQGTFGEDYDIDKSISRHTGFVLSTLTLIILVTIAASVEGSVLLSAFLAGAVVRYTWPSGGSNMEVHRPTIMFEEYYKPIMDHILVPFFFVSLLHLPYKSDLISPNLQASIGFSIPVSEMFASSIVWKGISYAILMFLAKASVGLVLYFDYFATKLKAPQTTTSSDTEETPQNDGAADENFSAHSKPPPRPPHLNAIIVGSTMISRGGFGFLVASEAQSSGTLNLQSETHIIHAETSVAKRAFRNVSVVEDQIFLVIIWALVLCTVAGPILSGIAVRRKLAAEKCGCGVEAGNLGSEAACHLCL
ncbi:hypothetical protein DSL72_009485 [Monilinia vaccinii-corymbosi]|uniref:Cation/H+ exchanger transmembrane domain-containing protein n=1 Tax=Monilinia vaccinii-corymbosi TaxID=61207 RepID=A0A8A3PPF9_9HELO|nr:hypothetical protein DSL72_009485 [Monilinia vaccinii-corymbosi]